MASWSQVLAVAGLVLTAHAIVIAPTAPPMDVNAMMGVMIVPSLRAGADITDLSVGFEHLLLAWKRDTQAANPALAKKACGVCNGLTNICCDIDGTFCCNPGETANCCARAGFCVQKGCCNSGATEKECGGGCIATAADCCADGTYCAAGSVCIGGGKCQYTSVISANSVQSTLSIASVQSVAAAQSQIAILSQASVASISQASIQSVASAATATLQGGQASLSQQSILSIQSVNSIQQGSQATLAAVSLQSIASVASVASVASGISSLNGAALSSASVSLQSLASAASVRVTQTSSARNGDFTGGVVKSSNNNAVIGGAVGGAVGGVALLAALAAFFILRRRRRRRAIASAAVIQNPPPSMGGVEGKSDMDHAALGSPAPLMAHQQLDNSSGSYGGSYPQSGIVSPAGVDQGYGYPVAQPYAGGYAQAPTQPVPGRESYYSGITAPNQPTMGSGGLPEPMDEGGPGSTYAHDQAYAQQHMASFATANSHPGMGMGASELPSSIQYGSSVGDAGSNHAGLGAGGGTNLPYYANYGNNGNQ